MGFSRARRSSTSISFRDPKTGNGISGIRGILRGEHCWHAGIPLRVDMIEMVRYDSPQRDSLGVGTPGTLGFSVGCSGRRDRWASLRDSLHVLLIRILCCGDSTDTLQGSLWTLRHTRSFSVPKEGEENS